MSGKATSVKKTISSEATSPAKHMSTDNRKPKIKSGSGTSSKKTISDKPASPKEYTSFENATVLKTIFAHVASSSSALFLDELQAGVTGTIIVMLCRIWDVSAIIGCYLSTDMAVSNVSHAVEYPILRYRLELGVSDETSHVVVVMFDETASELGKRGGSGPTQYTGVEEESLDDTSDLPATLSKFRLGAKAAVERASSSTIDAVPDVLRSSGKRLCRQSSVSTPLKSSEEKKTQKFGQYFVNTTISNELQDQMSYRVVDHAAEYEGRRRDS
ncbi:hypothetical protein Tco_1140786 [Tanacetum coccineum]